MPIVVKGVGTCRPKRKLPWKVNIELRRPFEARRTHTGKVHCMKVAAVSA
jgi:hypothetical protein